jgi:hypothetical protein
MKNQVVFFFFVNGLRPHIKTHDFALFFFNVENNLWYSYNIIWCKYYNTIYIYIYICHKKCFIWYVEMFTLIFLIVKF